VQVKTIVAANASPMTLDGTRTYIIGIERVAIIDPGPLLERHIDAVAEAIGSGVPASVLVTHWHSDHAEGAHALADRLHTSVTPLEDGDVIHTDAGELNAIATPGHTPDHFSFWWKAERAVFCGDLMMGGLDTALVAKPEGDLADYFTSLRVLRSLRPLTIFPAHGPAIGDPGHAIDRYIAHREDRLAQVRLALEEELSFDEITDRVYGIELDARLRPYAHAAVQAYVDYLREHDE
jgi:glyoxylase-like metal-dependent hydrolase (beta-lactamase superfamily II)